MSQYDLDTTNNNIKALIESLAVSGVAFSNDTINILAALAISTRDHDYHLDFVDRLKAEEDGDDYLYFIRPMQRHSVTIIQKIQVSVQAWSHDNAVDRARKLDNPLKHGEVYETEYVDVFVQD